MFNIDVISNRFPNSNLVFRLSSHVIALYNFPFFFKSLLFRVCPVRKTKYIKRQHVMTSIQLKKKYYLTKLVCLQNLRGTKKHLLHQTKWIEVISIHFKSHICTLLVFNTNEIFKTSLFFRNVCY